jgi:hypothetical protein
MESADSAHVAFVCYVMERVRQDRARDHDLAKSQDVVAAAVAQHHQATGQHLNKHFRTHFFYWSEKEGTTRASVGRFFSRRAKTRSSRSHPEPPDASHTNSFATTENRQTGSTTTLDAAFEASAVEEGVAHNITAPAAASRITDDLQVENVDDDDMSGAERMHAGGEEPAEEAVDLEEGHQSDEDHASSDAAVDGEGRAVSTEDGDGEPPAPDGEP